MLKVIQFVRLIFLFSLALSLSLTGVAFPIQFDSMISTAFETPANLLLAEASAPSTPRFDPKKVSQTLDRGDIAGAVHLIEQGWKQQYEEYYQGQLTSQLYEVDAISRILNRLHRQTGKKSALIYVIPTPTHLELILIPPTSVPVHKRIQAAPRQALLATVQMFRLGVVNPDKKLTEFLPAAQQLYQWLIAPLEPNLQSQGIDNLIFCLGGGLRSTPVAALHDGKYFLVEKYSLGIIPAFNLLDHRPTVLKNTRILAMGASEFQSLPPLPAVPLELSAITKNSWQGETLLNQSFTLENLKAKRANYPYEIIHLATHAEFSPGLVEDSYIQFWNQRLQLNQLKSLGLRSPVVQMLVLSACRTALGNLQAELGFAGLAVQAGSKAALASLWSVSDAGTLVLMSEFYHQLKNAPIKAEALRQTQIAMLKGQVNLKNSPAIRDGSNKPLPSELKTFENAALSHPYYWAAFTMIGNPW